MTDPAPYVLRSVGGIVVAVSADVDDLGLVERRFGRTPGSGEPELTLDLRATELTPPDRAADDRAVDADVWFDAAEMWWTWRGVTARLRSPTVAIARPSHRGAAVDAAVDLLAQYGLSGAAARRDRIMVHAAAVVREGEAVLVIGSSGAGKSTLSATALLNGWSLLGDDLAVVRVVGGGVTVEGVARPPMLPHEIVDRAANRLHGELVDPDRGRVEVPVAVLETGTHPVRAVVVVGHDDGDGRWEPVAPGARPGELMQGLAVPPVPPLTRSHLPMLAELARRPMMRLRHARPIDLRARRAVELLEEIWVAAGDHRAASGR